MLIKVWNHGILDGAVNEETNEYIKENETSVFDSLTEHIDYYALFEYKANKVKILALKELDDDVLKGLKLTFDFTPEEKRIRDKRKKEYLEKKAKVKVGKEYDIVRQVLKSIIVIMPDEGHKIIWFEAPFPNMKDKIFTFQDMYYKYPPDSIDEYDEGYRFTKKQLHELMIWLKSGDWGKYQDWFPMEEKWDIIDRFLKNYIVFTKYAGTIWIESPYYNSCPKVIQYRKMKYTFPQESKEKFAGYADGYKFTDAQLDMLLKWLKMGRESKPGDWPVD